MTVPVIDAIGIVGVLFEDGNDLSPSIAARLGSAAGEPLGWDLVCTDWYGGLILLSVNRDPASAGATLSDLAAYLRSLSPVPFLSGEGSVHPQRRSVGGGGLFGFRLLLPSGER